MAKQSYTIGQVLTAAEMTTLQTNDYNQTVSAKVASYVLVAADAGTRITMSNAAATTVTVNTALFTAGDTLIITNIGAGVCTITAGTATVSTAGSLALNQYDSGTLYFTSTGVSIWNGANPGDITGVTAGTGISGGGTSGAVTVTNSMATAITTNGDVIYGTGSGTFTRLGIGSSAQVLTVASGIPSWATPAGGGGMTLLDTLTLSGASVTSGTLSTAYKNLQIIIKNQKDNSADSIFIRLNGDSGTKYWYQGFYQQYRTVETFTNTTSGHAGTTRQLVAYAGNGTSANGEQGVINIYRYADTGNAVLIQSDCFYLETATANERTQVTGYYQNTAAITSVTLMINSGTFSSGTAYIYGVS